MPKKNNEYSIANFASTASYSPNQINRNDKYGVINVQLNSWLEAKKKYMLLKNNINYNWGDFIPIIKELGDSLAYLFGINYDCNMRTPSLKKFISNSLPQKGWDLKKDEPILFKDFERLDDYYKDISKHLNRLKVDKINALTVIDISRFMETTRRIWIWYLNKNYNYKIPDEQLIHLKDIV